ncbi:hypothetical protein [Lysobacter solisilvae (ex Woo and Kim 2020)]|uniref:Uncharacterized protein n=1 Tax=Agrilutibacter terrestris TaxID=2865112 RepID=A0A7H0FWU7_9GAMM|nr:hypothetical protein [Lysobacter terrestris]QNP40513.1 hypothetical protein H8B22_13750 [Lysobacter terrestris]
MDGDHVPELIRLGGSSAGLAQAQGIAAQAMAAAGLPAFPKNACAANLSALLQLAGLDFPMTFGAGKLAYMLGGKFDSRRWVHVRAGDQIEGDVGVTYDNDTSIPGSDHIYLVVKRVDTDRMVIADNQATQPHERFVSGKGKTPTEYFLRAPTMAYVLRSVPEAVEVPDILRLAEASDIAQYDWNQRGQAPKGYIKGMALAFADAYARLKGGEAVAQEMGREIGEPATDALAWYRNHFAQAGFAAPATASDRLRQLFVMLVGLGMRESSGRYCEGRDRSASNTSANTAEAGLFQMSYDLCLALPSLQRLMETYGNSTTLAEVFREGVRCKASDWENHGRGHGMEFQRLTKACPAFAVDCAAVALRARRKHWGPINKRAAEVRLECDSLLLAVQQLVDAA